MQIKKLTLKNYRNYEELELHFDDAVQLFLGNNAQGKTNIIEAIYYAAFGRSHRTRVDSELIQFDKENAKNELIFTRRGVEMKLEFSYNQHSRRRINLNNGSIRQKELIGTVNAVLFSPEDLYLVKGAPAERRRYIDAELSQSSPVYYNELIRYSHIIKQRNNLLKKIRVNEAAPDMLELWDSQLVPSAARIILYRLEAVAKLAEHAENISKIIASHEKLTIKYEINAPVIPVINLNEDKEKLTTSLKLWYNELLLKQVDRDIYRGSTTYGPHHDDLYIAVEGKDLRKYGSQGQQRTGALALKLAELSYITSEVGEKPILLLDDVMSELDIERRSALLEFIREEKIQTFITSTDAAYFPAGLIKKYYSVKSGKVNQIQN